jgi:hypothetical protein
MALSDNWAGTAAFLLRVLGAFVLMQAFEQKIAENAMEVLLASRLTLDSPACLLQCSTPCCP